MTKLEFAHEDIGRFLASTEKFDPIDVPDPRIKNINIIMAATIMVRVYDEMKRRVDQDTANAFEQLREGIGEFKYDKTIAAGKVVLERLSKCSPKLMPVDLTSIKVFTIAMVDVGALNPPFGLNLEALKEEINTTRTVIISMANNMARKFKVSGEDPKGENPN